MAFVKWVQGGNGDKPHRESGNAPSRHGPDLPSEKPAKGVGREESDTDRCCYSDNRPTIALAHSSDNVLAAFAAPMRRSGDTQADGKATHSTVQLCFVHGRFSGLGSVLAESTAIALH